MNISGIRLISRSALCSFYTPVRNAADFRKAPITPAIASLGKKKQKSETGVKKQREEMVVETDTNKLVNYVCGTDIFQGSEPIKIKPDSEYPDWLWKVNTGPAKRLRDCERGSKEYYENIKIINMARRIKLDKCRKIK